VGGELSLPQSLSRFGSRRNLELYGEGLGKGRVPVMHGGGVDEDGVRRSRGEGRRTFHLNKLGYALTISKRKSPKREKE
jgi:hypothetical protein